MVQEGEVNLKQFERAEKEVFSANYERFSWGKEIRSFVDKYNIKTVCELPAHGAKAAPSLYSINFALQEVSS